MSNVFKINNLRCAYKETNHVVLEIDELTIPAGKVTSIIGQSGSGKSTFIETLGLMNHTILQGNIEFTGTDGEWKLDSKAWNHPNKLASLRKKYFSFIFQNDYLMPYYTPFENIMVGQSDNHNSQKQAWVDKTSTIESDCDWVGLSLREGQMPYQMSGGQRQRLSFVRAISKDYTVIFGDEPTGNLDDETSRRLMEVLCKSLKHKEGRAAILVSHNIMLSVKYSNRIIVLTPGNREGFTVRPENVFDKRDDLWINAAGKEMTDKALSALILDLIAQNSTNTKSSRIHYKPKSKEKKSLQKIIRQNEFKALKGTRYSTVLYLLFILWISFLCFGFSKSAFNYQEKLSRDPFSNWVNIVYNHSTEKGLKQLMRTVEEDSSLISKFHINHLFYYSRWRWFTRPNRPDPFPELIQCRSIDQNAGVIKSLLKKENIVRINVPDKVPIDSLFQFEPNGLIVTEELLKTLHMPDSTVCYLPVRIHGSDHYYRFPILAVVKALPDLSNLICTKEFYAKTERPGFGKSLNNQYYFIIEDFPAELWDSLYSRIAQKLGRELWDGTITGDLNFGKKFDRTILKITIENSTQYYPEEDIDQFLENNELLKGLYKGRYYNLEWDTAIDLSNKVFDALAIEFKNLKEIRKFAEYLKKEYGLEMNMETMTQRENYLFAGNIAFGAIIMVLILSVVSVAIFITSTIKNHLEKVKKNLGNFLAFGMPNKNLVIIYTRVALRILISALIPAFLLAWLTGEATERHILHKFFVLEAGQNYFSILNIWYLMFLSVIILIVISRTLWSVVKILGNTPGDLVYERDEKSGNNKKTK